VHAPSGLQKYAGDGCGLAQQVFQGGFSGAARDALDGLAKLHLVAKQDDIFGAGAHGNEIGQGHLTGFIHEQIVQGLIQAWVGKQPCRARDKLMEARIDLFVGKDVLDEPSIEMGFRGVPVALLYSGKGKIRFQCDLLHIPKQIVDGLVAVGGLSTGQNIFDLNIDFQYIKNYYF